MADDYLRSIQLAELGILKKVIKIFEQNNLTYYALGGTLLGAVRHQGFIPWDDDIDIGMPRPDYEKFIEIAESSLEAPLDIATTLNGHSRFTYYYPRVIDTSIDIVRKGSEKETIIHPWIDVFPLDGVPEDDNELHNWYKKVLKLQKKFKFSQFEYFYTVNSPEGEKSNKHRAIKTFAKSVIYNLRLYKLVSKKKVWSQLDGELNKYDYASSTRLINACGYWKIKELFPKLVYGTGKMYPFEDIQIRGPEDYDFVLTQMYGDYMTPPPKTERDHHKTSAE